VHGSDRPAGTLGFATPTRPGSRRPDPDSDGIRVTQANVKPRCTTRPVPPRPSVSLLRQGRDLYARTRTRMASESLKATSLPTGPGQPRPLPGLGRHCRTRTGASVAGDMPIVDVQKHHSGRYGVLSALQPREPHLTTMLELVASTADRLVSVKGPTVLERAPFAHRTNAVCM
jgi:hypothetical protein